MAFFSEEQNIANTNWKRSIHLNSPWRKTKLAFVTIINWIHFPSPPPRISSLKERFSRPGGGTTYAVLPSAQKQWKKRREKEWVEQRDREQKRAAHLWPWSLGMKWTLKPQVRSPCPTPSGNAALQAVGPRQSSPMTMSSYSTLCNNDFTGPSHLAKQRA